MRLLLFALLFSVLQSLGACQSSVPVELQPCGVPGGTCEDNNPCTVDSCDPNTNQCLFTPQMTVECLPGIIIQEPARGVSFEEEGPVKVAGTATTSMGTITEFTINDMSIPLNPDGSFSHYLLPEFGMNLIVARLRDSAGFETQAVQSFFHSSAWNPRDPHDPTVSALKEALYFWLGRNAIDDSKHSLTHINDLATVAELLVRSEDPSTLIDPEVPVKSFEAPGLGTTHVHLTEVRLEDPTVNLTPQEGGLHLRLTYASLEADLEFRQPGPTVGAVNVSRGMASASPLVIEADIWVATSNTGAVEVTTSEAHVVMENFSIALDLDNDSLEAAINTVLNILKQLFLNQIEATFEEQLSATLEELLAGSLNSPAFEFEAELPPLSGDAEPTPLHLKSIPTSAEFTRLGGTLGFTASTTSNRGLYYPTLGSISTRGCPDQPATTLWFDPTYSIQVALSDDFINQLIFSGWWGGAFQFPIPNPEEGVGQLSRIGITGMQTSVDLLHSPVLTACNPAGALRVQIGDMKTRLLLEVTGGEEVGLNVFTSLEADVEYRIIPTEEGPALSLHFNHMRRLETEVVLDDPGLLRHKKTLQKFIEEFFITALIENLTSGDGLGSPLPTIDLSAVEGIAPGHELVLDVSRVHRIANYTVVSGDPATEGITAIPTSSFPSP